MLTRYSEKWVEIGWVILLVPFFNVEIEIQKG